MVPWHLFLREGKLVDRDDNIIQAIKGFFRQVIESTELPRSESP